MRRELSRDESGQMLLMTGLILMFALLTMSLNTVKTASLGEPYDAHKDAVLDAKQMAPFGRCFGDIGNTFGTFGETVGGLGEAPGRLRRVNTAPRDLHKGRVWEGFDG